MKESESTASKKKSVTLKKTVTIQAIVTEDLKLFLNFELQGALKASQVRMQESEMYATPLIQKYETENNAEQVNMLQSQLQAERAQYRDALQDIKRRMDQVQQFEIDSLYTHGTIEGFVTIREGDNLYQKLGGMEIVIKDGIVQEIRDTLPES